MKSCVSFFITHQAFAPDSEERALPRRGRLLFLHAEPVSPISQSLDAFFIFHQVLELGLEEKSLSKSKSGGTSVVFDLRNQYLRLTWKRLCRQLSAYAEQICKTCRLICELVSRDAPRSINLPTTVRKRNLKELEDLRVIQRAHQQLPSHVHMSKCTPFIPVYSSFHLSCLCLDRSLRSIRSPSLLFHTNPRHAASTLTTLVINHNMPCYHPQLTKKNLSAEANPVHCESCQINKEDGESYYKCEDCNMKVCKDCASIGIGLGGH